MPIVETLTAISTGLKIAKDLREIGKSIDEATFKLKIAELTEALADAKAELVAVQEELSAKDAEISRLKEAAKFRAEETVTKDGLLYQREADNTVAMYPFCPRCQAKEGLFIRLMPRSNLHQVDCPNCHTHFSGRAVWYTRPPEVVREDGDIAAFRDWSPPSVV